MKKYWSAGVESDLLDEIIKGRKIIEGRLNRGKFRDCKIGDIICLRRDFNDDPEKDSVSDSARVLITNIIKYKNFKTLLEEVGYKNAIPTASSIEEAYNEYLKYYSEIDQNKFGVVAIEIKIIYYT